MYKKNKENNFYVSSFGYFSYIFVSIKKWEILIDIFNYVDSNKTDIENDKNVNEEIDGDGNKWMKMGNL